MVQQVVEQHLQKRPRQTCQICTIVESIYNCPNCSMKTCSLQCYKDHLQKYNCTGKRDRTKFVPLNKFTNSTLSSDYYFLEDVLTSSQRGKRLYGTTFDQRNDAKKQRIHTTANNDNNVPTCPLLKLHGNESTTTTTTTTTTPSNKNNLSSMLRVCHSTANVTNNTQNKHGAQLHPRKKKLLQQAQQRNITILFMPSMMQRSINNKSSKYDLKKKCLIWKVDFVFHFYEEEKHDTNILTVDRMYDNAVISVQLYRIMEQEAFSNKTTESKARAILKSFSVKKDDICIYLKKLPCSSSQPQYKQICQDQTLDESLHEMTVIEYPTLDIVLKPHSHLFPTFIQEVT